MASTIKERRGLKADLPVLSIGEQGFCTDTGEMYIGTATGNRCLNHDSLSLVECGYVDPSEVTMLIEIVDGFPSYMLALNTFSVHISTSDVLLFPAVAAYLSSVVSNQGFHLQESVFDADLRITTQGDENEIKFIVLNIKGNSGYDDSTYNIIGSISTYGGSEHWEINKNATCLFGDIYSDAGFSSIENIGNNLNLKNHFSKALINLDYFPLLRSAVAAQFLSLCGTAGGVYNDVGMFEAYHLNDGNTPRFIKLDFFALSNDDDTPYSIGAVITQNGIAWTSSKQQATVDGYIANRGLYGLFTGDYLSIAGAEAGASFNITPLVVFSTHFFETGIFPNYDITPYALSLRVLVRYMVSGSSTILYAKLKVGPTGTFESEYDTGNRWQGGAGRVNLYLYPTAFDVWNWSAENIRVLDINIVY